MSFIGDISPVPSRDDTTAYRSSSAPRSSLSRRNSGNLDISSETHTSRTRSGMSLIKQEIDHVTQKEFAHFQLQLRSLTTRITDIERKNLKVNPSVVDSTWREILKIRAFVGYVENSPHRRTRSSYDDIQYEQRTPSPSGPQRPTSQSNRFFPRASDDGDSNQQQPPDDDVYAALSPLGATDSPHGFSAGGLSGEPMTPLQGQMQKLVMYEVSKQLQARDTPSQAEKSVSNAAFNLQKMQIFIQNEELKRHTVTLDEMRERTTIQQKIVNVTFNLHSRLSRGYHGHLDELHNLASSHQAIPPPHSSSAPLSITSRNMTPERLSKRRLQNRYDLVSPPDNRRSMSPVDPSDEEDMRDIARMRSGGAPPSSSSHAGKGKISRTTSNTSGFHSPAVTDRLKIKANALLDIICDDTALLRRISMSSINKGAWSSAFNASLSPAIDKGSMSQWQVDSDDGGSPTGKKSVDPEWLKLIKDKCLEESEKAIFGVEKYVKETTCPSLISAAMGEALVKLEDQLGERFESRMKLLESAIDGHKRQANIQNTSHIDELQASIAEAKRDISDLVTKFKSEYGSGDEHSGKGHSPTSSPPHRGGGEDSVLDRLISNTAGKLAPRSLVEFVLLRPITAFEIEHFSASASNSSTTIVRKAFRFLEGLKSKSINILNYLNSTDGGGHPMYATPSKRLDLHTMAEALRGYLSPSDEDGSLLTWQQHLIQMLESSQEVVTGGGDRSDVNVDITVTATRLFYHASHLATCLGTAFTTPQSLLSTAGNGNGRLVFDVEYERSNPTGTGADGLRSTVSNMVQDIVKNQQQIRSTSDTSYRSENSSYRPPAAAPPKPQLHRTVSSPAARPGYPHLAPTVPLNESNHFRSASQPHHAHAHVKGVFSPSSKPRTPYEGHGDTMPSPSAKRPTRSNASFTQPIPQNISYDNSNLYQSSSDRVTAMDHRNTESKHVVRSPSAVAQYAEIHHTSRSSSAQHRPTTVVHHHYHPKESLENANSSVISTPPRESTAHYNFYDREESVPFVPLSTHSPSSSRTGGLYAFNAKVAKAAEDEQRRLFKEKAVRAAKNSLAAARLYHHDKK